MTNSTSIILRDALPSDAATILHFITELAIYEKEPDAVKTDEHAILKTLFSDGATAHSVICLDGDEPIGFAVYFYNYSTWLGKNGLYLEDLYVSPDSRGKGAGKLIMQHLARQAIAKECGRFEWVVLDWNKPAIDFYNSMGAEPQNEWIIYRLTGQALIDFAENK
ncbi:GNAT family N-acetyltransferase [Pseudoalteromonas sp. NEC-BIFX-2020_002]|uniref:GNAT family N-acetyltransferase n=1 Tax=Pseudoalteromonas sp. NEC-BIFX-2020_002 TaxID=2732353 RepID=UPI0014772149|nr:GNAT family N-acetyltransferase [Pseudoalteromonas sp. NEC-BIFX-2020_002]NNG45227.1 GNAT family N-acetyltransferase [Pseudoalteromonas sp. NEC-BIFX-2020_002]